MHDAAERDRQPRRDDPVIETPTIDWAALAPELVAPGGSGDRDARSPSSSPKSLREAARRDRLRGSASSARSSPRRPLRPTAPTARSRRATRSSATARGARADPIIAALGAPRGRGRLLASAAAASTRASSSHCSRRPARDDLPRRGERPDDALPRPRVVLDLRSTSCARSTSTCARLAGGRAQVPRSSARFGSAVAPLRLGARLRGDRRPRLRRDRAARRRTPSTTRSSSPASALIIAGLGVQGLGRAVPHVDARRLRGRADAGDGVHVRGDEDRGARR